MKNASSQPSDKAHEAGERLCKPLPPRREPQNCGDIDMRIGRDGTWYYQGSPIGRKELVCLFASVLKHTEDGEYWLITPAEMGRIQVEDAPFVAVQMYCCNGGHQVLSFRTNIDECVTAGADNPIRVVFDPQTGEPRPYILVRKGLEARIERSVYYELVAYGHEEDINGERVFGVWSSGTFFPLGKLEED